MYISNLALYAIANKNKGNWCSYVPSVQAAYNSSPHEATGFSPHYLVYGYDWEPPIVVTLNIPERPMPTEWNLYQEDFLDKIKFIREKAIEFNQEYQRKVKEKFDSRARPHSYKVGDMVYMQLPKSKLGYGKLCPKFSGPFSIGHADQTNVELYDERNYYMGRFNVNRIKPYRMYNNMRSIREAQELENEDPIWKVDHQIESELSPKVSEGDEETLGQQTQKKESCSTFLKDGHGAEHSSPNTRGNKKEEIVKIGVIKKHKFVKGNLFYLIRYNDGTETWMQEEKTDGGMIDEYSMHTVVRKSYPKRKFSMVLGILMPTYVIKIFIIIAMTMAAQIIAVKIPPRVYIDLGTLYNCDQVKLVGLYGFPEIDFCKQNLNTNPVKFTSEVFQFHPEEKMMNIYMNVIRSLQI